MHRAMEGAYCVGVYIFKQVEVTLNRKLIKGFVFITVTGNYGLL